MRRLSNIILILCITLLLVLPTISSYADDWPVPHPFYLTSEDQSKLFFFQTHEWPDGIELDESMRDLVTGLYYNTNPPELIYPVEIGGPFREEDFFFSHDLHYFVWRPSENLRYPSVEESIALRFYGYGELLAEYLIMDLVSDMDTVRQSTTMAMWLSQDHHPSIEFDSTTNLLRFITSENEEYWFDITTGTEIGIDSPDVGRCSEWDYDYNDYLSEPDIPTDEPSRTLSLAHILLISVGVFAVAMIIVLSIMLVVGGKKH